MKKSVFFHTYTPYFSHQTCFLHTLFRIYFIISPPYNQSKIDMANLINDFLSMPLWLSLPLCAVYLALLAYFVYILWRYRGKSNLVKR